MVSNPDVLVIGGGQAGLAASYRLAQAGLSHLVVDASERIGDSWRRRYHSLTLFTPRRLSALPGLALEGDPEGYAGRLEFADYLERYALINRLPIQSGSRVVRLEKAGPKQFVANIDDGTVIGSQAVVVSTGGFQQAVVPSISSGFDPKVRHLTMANYRSPLSVGKGPVLVVGDGASGRDIAMELAATHEVLVATGKARRLFPERLFGIGTWTLMDRLGLLSASASSPIGRVMRRTDSFPDRGRSLASLRSRGVSIRPRLVEAVGKTAIFSNGSRADVRTVIWAVGYGHADDWIEVPAGTAGLHYLGRPWQRNRASALILGATGDSKVVVDTIVRQLGQP